MPDGNESLKASPVSPTVEFGLVIVKLSVDVPFTAILVGEKPLLMAGGATLASEKLAGVVTPDALAATL